MQKHTPYLKVILPIIGGIIGLGLYLVSKMALFNEWTQGCYAFLLVLGFFLTFLVPHLKVLKLMAVSSVIALVFSYATVYSIRQDTLAMSIASFSLLPLSLYMLFCFVAVYFEQDAWRFPYDSLFLVAWSSALILLLSLFFTLLCWGLLGLIAYLFKNIGFNFLDRIFYSLLFSCVLSGGLLGLGIAIGREYEQLISSLRRILLVLCYFLLPVLSVFGILYLILLCFGQSKSSIDTYLYLNVSLIAIFLLNGTYQTGDQPAPYARPVRWCVNVFFFLFPIFPLLLLHDLLVSMSNQYYLNSVYPFFVYCVILFAYSMGYFIAVLSNKIQWFFLLKRINVVLAVIVIIVGVGLHTPLLDYMHSYQGPYENGFSNQ